MIFKIENSKFELKEPQIRPQFPNLTLCFLLPFCPNFETYIYLVLHYIEGGCWHPKNTQAFNLRVSIFGKVVSLRGRKFLGLKSTGFQFWWCRSLSLAHVPSRYSDRGNTVTSFFASSFLYFVWMRVLRLYRSFYDDI